VGHQKFKIKTFLVMSLIDLPMTPGTKLWLIAHWLPEISNLIHVGHYFWPGLMGMNGGRLGGKGLHSEPTVVDEPQLSFCQVLPW
jgi:hypothetical protein